MTKDENNKRFNLFNIFKNKNNENKKTKRNKKVRTYNLNTDDVLNSEHINTSVALPSRLMPSLEERESILKKLKLKEIPKVVSKDDTMWLLLIVVFSFMLHLYIFTSGYLYGVHSTDSTVQMIYFLPFIIRELFFNGKFWSFSYGMGGDIFSEFSYYYTTSPMMIIALVVYFFGSLMFGNEIFSLENSLKIKLFLSITKQILFMIFMYYLLKYEEKSQEASFSGAVIYGGGIFYMWNSNYFDFFTDAFLWLPLMVLGFRIYQKTRNFFPLVISAALAVINSFYFGYHSYVFFIIFVLIMTEGVGKNFKERLSNYFKKIGQMALIGISALLLSSFAFIPQILAFIKIDRFAVNYPVSLFYETSFYQNLPISLFFNSSTLGIPMIILMALFLNYKGTTKTTNRKMILLLVFFIMYLLPFTGYFLNGMNYSSERWYYQLLFVFGYVTADLIEEVKKKNNFSILYALIIFISFTTMIYFRREELENYSKYKVFSISVLALNIIIFSIISIRKYLERKQNRILLDKLLAIMIAGVMISNNFAFSLDQNLDMSTSLMQENKMVSSELKDVLSKTVPSDGEFYRTIFRDNTFENAPTYYNYYGISTFQSLTDGNQHNWIKKILDIRHDIVYLSSFNNLDDRNYLESLLGVKYLVIEKDSFTPPPTYERIYQNSKYELWRANQSVGFDLWYKNNITLDSFLKLGIADKDLNLLNFAVTEEEYNQTLLSKPMSAEEIQINDKTMSFDNVELNGDTLNFKDKGEVKFFIPDANPYSQVYINYYLRPEDKNEFEQKMNDKKSFKASESNPYVYHTNDWTFVLNGSEKEVKWTTNSKFYELKNLTVKRLSLKDFPRLLNERNKYNLENLKFSKNKITGTINNDEEGFLVLNLPYNSGWNLTVNGQQRDLKRMNGFLSGIHLDKGSNKIELNFVPSGLILGSIISIFTLLFLIIYYRLTSGRRKFETLRREEVRKRTLKEALLDRHLAIAREKYVENYKEKYEDRLENTNKI